MFFFRAEYNINYLNEIIFHEKGDINIDKLNRPLYRSTLYNKKCLII